MAKIELLDIDGQPYNARALVQSKLEENPDINAVVIAYRLGDDGWRTAWGGEKLTNGGLAMASVILQRHIQAYLAGEDTDD